MKLNDLISGLNYKVYGKSRIVVISSISNNSRIAGPGSLFIAKMGSQVDGNDFAEDAVKNGAVAVLSSFHNPFLKVPQIICDDVYEAEAVLVERFYEFPSKELYTVGITGTNGKTTVSYLLKQLLDKINYSCGLIGTIEYILGGNTSLTGDNTTPDAVSNRKFLREMVKNRCKAAVMEVSSIGLSHKRTHGIEFNIAVFTNLSQDHLDFHGSFEAYAQEKNKLFRSLTQEGLAVLNYDSLYKHCVAEQCPARQATYGLSPEADVFAENIVLGSAHTQFTVSFSGIKHVFETSLIGIHNVYNLLIPILIGLVEFDMSLSELAVIIADMKPPKGRLEPILNGPCKIFIDYAHTPDGLEKVLGSLEKTLSPSGKLITVVGCGGERDHAKRPLMGKIVEKYGLGIITTDNPRSEDPNEIIGEILSGFKNDNYIVEVDRRQAIEKALKLAGSEDIVLIAGRGHESYQRFKHYTIPFDDKSVVEELLKESNAVL